MSDDRPTEIAIAVVFHDARFLIGQRPEGVPLAGYWEFPGGKLLGGESPQEAALRECREETGLEVAIERPLVEILHEYPHGILRLHVFLARPKGGASPPLAPFRWVNGQSLRDYSFPQANQAILNCLAECGYLEAPPSS